MMIGHLQERTFASWALDPTDAVAVAHLNECDACRREAVDFRSRLTAFREALLVAGDQRRLEWAAPVESETRHISLPLAILTWAPRVVLATILLAFAIVTYRPKPVAPPVSADANDEALLLSINDDLNRNVPKALAPAEFIVSEANESGGTNQKAGQ